MQCKHKHTYQSVAYGNRTPNFENIQATRQVSKTKIDRIRIQQNRESCGIRSINEWAERKEEEEENGTKM